ncbi:MAG: hypothetical protein U1A77_15545 [Pirellulales bacterium]
MVSFTCRRCCFLTLACLFLTGCVTKSVTESGISVQYHWGIALGALAAGILAAPLGLVVRSFSSRLSWGLFVLGPVAILMIAPTAYREGVTIHADGFEVYSGIWGLTASQAVKFDNQGSRTSKACPCREAVACLGAAGLYSPDAGPARSSSIWTLRAAASRNAEGGRRSLAKPPLSSALRGFSSVRFSKVC